MRMTTTTTMTTNKRMSVTTYGANVACVNNVNKIEMFFLTIVHSSDTRHTRKK
jgi:hypothetical protein